MAISEILALGGSLNFGISAAANLLEIRILNSEEILLIHV